ncbi:MAG: sigma-70 family RNA polymerase sigma factor [Myxococcales bacterium]|nr:sigma-70 family RNA polymerase sigma factor [Myxococcales bacterium]
MTEGMKDPGGQIDAARRGEESAYRALYERYRPGVVRLLEAFGTLDFDEREDIVQDTFTRAFKSLSSLATPSSFEAWLYTIARNRAKSALAKRSSEDRTMADYVGGVLDTVPPFPESLMLEVDLAVVRDLIERLPPGPEKDTVQLFYVEGQLSAREIAEKLGVGKSAITMRLERFRARVKRELMLRVLAGKL